MNVDDPFSIEIPPHSPQRSCPALCSSHDSTAFDAGSGIQVLLQSAPVELDELQMRGINHLRQIKKIIERRDIVAPQNA